jgi:CBS domain-containing protein
MKPENLLLVERVMKFMPWTVQPSDSVAHARALLADERINHLLVLSKGKLVGVVSARDLQATSRSNARAIKRALETHPDHVRVASDMKANRSYRKAKRYFRCCCNFDAPQTYRSLARHGGRSPARHHHPP